MLDPSVGGILECHFSHPLLGPVYPLRLAVTLFDLTPAGLASDYLYTGAGTFTPSESGVIATFAALGLCWAPYYTADWSLTLAAVYANVAGAAVPLAMVPAAAVVLGIAAGVPSGSMTKRSIALYSTAGQRWRLWLRQLAATMVGETVPVAAASGGVDVRDQNWYAYIAGGRSALCGRDGLPLQPGGKVREWWDTPPAPYLVSG